MKNLWVRWLLLTAFVAALAVTFVNLGQWQLDRLDQRRDSNANVAAHEQAPVVSFDEAFGDVIGDDDQWQRVEVTGTFLGDRQLQARYRSFNDATGWELVTPLVTADGRTVLVDRGFVQRPADEDFPRTYPPPPPGEVTVLGFVRRNEQGRQNALTPTQDTVRLINSEAIEPWLGRPLVNGYVTLISVDPPQQGPLQPLTPPPLTEGPHLSYALQWFTFTLIAGIGLFVLIRNDILDRKKAAAKAARAQGAAHGPGPD